MQGRVALPFRTSYAASKHALHGFFEALRAEVSDRGVQVTMVEPSYVRTALSHRAVRGNGEAHGSQDATTQKGMEASYVAETVVDAVAEGRTEVILATLYERSGAVCRALLPSLFDKIMARKARKGWPAQRAAEARARKTM